jgi:phospho-N-acetylmuramoyl-pentapeptide-transferase
LRAVEMRAALAALSSFLIALAFGRWFIAFLRRRQVLERAEKGDSARLTDLHRHKSSTPTMGGVILLVATFLATLAWGRLESRAVWLLLAVMLAFGAIGFADDLIKLRSRRKGLSARFKLFLQLGASALAGAYLYLEPLAVELPGGLPAPGTALFFPFLAEFHLPLGALYILLVIFVTSGASNAVNLTDGLDGLAIGCSTLVAITFVLVALLAGSQESSAFLAMPHVPGCEEVAVVCAALAGAGLGFLWFNCHPAQIFMGDTGSLALGAALGLSAVLVKQELLLALAGGVLVIEALSVVLQVLSFKLRGKRIFLIAPLHHHYQFKGWPETKVTVCFWLAGAVLAAGSLVSLRMR